MAPRFEMDDLGKMIVRRTRRIPASDNGLMRTMDRTNGTKPLRRVKGRHEFTFLAPPVVANQIRAMALAHRAELGPFILDTLTEALKLAPRKTPAKGRTGNEGDYLFE